VLCISDPDIPADIKAAATGEDSILLVWRPPLHSNGVLTKYTVLMKDMSNSEVTMVSFFIFISCMCSYTVIIVRPNM